MSASSSSTLPSLNGSAKLAQKHVLFLSPRWRSDQHGGVTALTRHLVDNIRTIDPTGAHVKIYCLVALLDQYISQEEKTDARNDHVVLLGARPPRGDESKPSTKWMDLYPSTYYAKTLEYLPQMTHIVGHLPYLPNGPSNIRDYIYKGDPSVKLILVNHEAPYNEQGELDEDQLEFWAKSADVLVSVGHAVFDLIETILMDSKSDVKHDLYLPTCPVEFLKYDWLDYHKVSNHGNPSGTQNILICCPERQMSRSLDFETAVTSIASAATFLVNSAEPKDKVKVTLTLTANDKDRDQWKRDFYNIMERQNALGYGNVGLSLHENENMDKMIAIMNRANLVIHPQDHESAFLGLDILCAASMGVPVLVQEHSSIACLLENVRPGTTSAVKRLDDQESEEDAWSRMIVDKLRDVELAAKQGSAIRKALLRDTSIHRSHAAFVQNILDPFRLEIEFAKGCKIFPSGRRLGKLFGVSFNKDENDDVTYVASVLSTLLHQREKTSVELINKLIVPTEGEAFDGLTYRLLTSLEGDHRCILDIRSEASRQSSQNQLVFDIHCTTTTDLINLCEDLSDTEGELAKLLEETLQELIEFTNATVKVKEHENADPVEELGDFVISIKGRPAASKHYKAPPAPGKPSRLPIAAKPPLKTKQTYTALHAADTEKRNGHLTNGKERKPVKRRETYGVGDETWTISKSPQEDSNDDVEY